MKPKTLPTVRYIILIFSALAINGYFSGWFFKPHLYTGKFKGIIVPVLNCYACPSAIPSCPIGTIQHFMVIGFVPLFALGILIIVGALVGRLFCGWVCPFGFIQELLNKIPTPKWKLPKGFTYLKYFFLVFTVFLIPYLISDTVFCKICPMGALEGGIPQMLLKPELHHLISKNADNAALNPDNKTNPDNETDSEQNQSVGLLYRSKLVILAVTIFLAIFIKRFFCRAICPIGAFFAIFNKISILQMKVHMPKCSTCDVCKKNCPVDINVYDDPNSPECIRCGLCTNSCPFGAVKFTTIFSGENKNKKINVATKLEKQT